MSDKPDKNEPDIQASTTKLEEAVQELVSTAKKQLSGRATAFVEETTARLRSELGIASGDQDPEDDYDEFEVDPVSGHRLQGQRRSRRPQKSSSRRARHARRHNRVPRTRHLYRDTRHQKIAGVCAGVANYYGVEIWVARCIAITGMLFMPSITFPAYCVAYFILDKEPGADGVMGKREKRRQAKKEKRSRKSNRVEQPSKYVSPAPELGPQLSPRRGLRNTQADFDELELRLRRMESHVTSGQYELQRELHKIDTDPSVQTN